VTTEGGDWVATAELARTERLRRLDAAPATTLRTGTAWLATGAVVGLGLLGLGTVIGLVVLVLALVAAALLWRRAPLGKPLGVLGFGALPAAVLFVAAVRSTGCTPGTKVALHAGELGKHRLVPCDEVVAGYVSMAVFFTMVAIGGAIWLVAQRNARRHARAELAAHAAV
jgi:hypothetical protein